MTTAADRVIAHNSGAHKDVNDSLCVLCYREPEPPNESDEEYMTELAQDHAETTDEDLRPKRDGIPTERYL